MFKYNTDIIELLKTHGYNTNKIRKDRIMGESMLQKIRNGEMVSWATFDKLCRLLDCDIGDLIHHTSESAPDAAEPTE